MTDECIYVGVREHVIKPADSDHENITILVTICADGTSISLVVIYKGEVHCQQPWVLEKGYVNGKFGLEWIKHFDKTTKAKVAGCHHLLLIDGDVSYYTFTLLDYAYQNHILVLCYPLHATHIYQGLDIVMFSILKHSWTEVQWKFKQKGAKVTKSNFLSMYAHAHLEALTTDNIKAAF
ncbi:hypothetical protein L227DRAFT_587190 [Lentinus tigrinus ALCF2SS1-6]|uniref:DDE-1 domain-containing protein n=1 Tax=Lentinus tigrinus ALCF2SS1-6 TaxID=1328759 RepID=A0A5C2S4E8_9APHY|nr:hypothetical protein L227DRAFT_587190 [Lentinus tigrinus ALCF2SS1-6]